MGSNWETFRYLIEKFGFDKGRLIAEFPKKAWFREVYDAAGGFSPTQRARLEILLKAARGTKVIRACPGQAATTKNPAVCGAGSSQLAAKGN